MAKAARRGDRHECPMLGPPPASKPHGSGVVIGGASTVQVGFQGAARMGDACACPGIPNAIVTGSGTVTIEHRPAARVADRTAHGGVLTSGATDVEIG